MRVLPAFFAACALSGCPAPTFDTPADVTAYCAEGNLRAFDTTISFGASSGCAWGADGNLDAEEGVYTARAETFLEVPDLVDAAICSLDMDFSSGFEFDDDLFLTWNGAVLLTNQGGVLDNLGTWERYPIWSWTDLVEFAFPGPFQQQQFCAGADEGLAECELPSVSGGGVGGGGTWSGDLEYDPDAEVVAELAWRALELGTPEVGLVVTGDNDDTDCTHTALDVQLSGTAVFF